MTTNFKSSVFYPNTLLNTVTVKRSLVSGFLYFTLKTEINRKLLLHFCIQFKYNKTEFRKTNSDFYHQHCVKSVRVRSYSGPYFSALGLNTERYEISLRIQSKYGNIPNMDNFHAVQGIAEQTEFAFFLFYIIIATYNANV